MHRSDFLKALALLPLSGALLKLRELASLTDPLKPTDPMPVLFLGHGSPMNAIEENEFVKAWRELGASLPRPTAILCVSAHWETRGTFVTAMPRPKTIHDFGGFPQELFDVQYPAPGSRAIALETQKAIQSTAVGLDEQWGLDHGCWSILRPMFPKADIPVLQLSLDQRQPPQYHYDLARQLASLRRKGVLIIGSGNIVHNLGMIAWDKVDRPEYGHDWAVQANDKLKRLILDDDHRALIDYRSLGREVALSVPSPDHYLPLLYALALKEPKEDLSLFNDKTVMGSVAMTSVRIS
jgi:4,5-DOPA dioxygenase extradiol